MTAEHLVMHLGHTKTGTTTLQKTFVQSEAALARGGVIFPDLYPHSGNGIILGYHLLGDQTDTNHRAGWLKMSHAQAQEASEAAWAGIVNAVRKAPPRTLLLSSETHFDLIRRDTIQRFDALTSDVAERKTAVAYVRAPDGFFISSLQQRLKHVQTHIERIANVSRTRVRDTVEPLTEGWSGTVDLRVFDRTVLVGGDIVTDFAANHLPDVDPAELTRPTQETNTSLSAEAMALLYDCNRGRLGKGVAHQAMIDQIIRSDAKISEPTAPRLIPGVTRVVEDWSAPDLIWLRDVRGVVFPKVDYRALELGKNAKDPATLDSIEQICDVDADRKAALYEHARKRAKLPKVVRRWLTKW